MAGVGYGIALAIRQELFQAHINPGVLASRLMHDASLCLYRKLRIVAIGPFDEANALDLLRWKRFDMLPNVTNQPQAPNVAPISESDMFAVRFQLPSRLFVLDRTVISLKTRIALLPWLVCLAVLIETGDRVPCPISRRLTCLGIEASGKGKVFCQHRT